MEKGFSKQEIENFLLSRGWSKWIVKRVSDDLEEKFQKKDGETKEKLEKFIAMLEKGLKAGYISKEQYEIDKKKAEERLKNLG